MKQYFESLMTSDKSLLIAVLVFLDQLTKYLFFDHRRGENLLLLTPVFNHGISGGYLLHKGLILIISLCALVVFYKLYQIRYLRKIAYILLMGGTIGNLLDRVILGGVRDFVDLQFFPVFNIADMYLTGAVVITFVLYYRSSRQSKNQGKYRESDSYQTPFFK